MSFQHHIPPSAQANEANTTQPEPVNTVVVITKDLRKKLTRQGKNKIFQYMWMWSWQKPNMSCLSGRQFVLQCYPFSVEVSNLHKWIFSWLIFQSYSYATTLEYRRQAHQFNNCYPLCLQAIHLLHHPATLQSAAPTQLWGIQSQPQTSWSQVPTNEYGMAQDNLSGAWISTVVVICSHVREPLADLVSIEDMIFTTPFFTDLIIDVIFLHYPIYTRNTTNLNHVYRLVSTAIAVKLKDYSNGYYEKQWISTELWQSISVEVMGLVSQVWTTDGEGLDWWSRGGSHSVEILLLPALIRLR